jgi:RimJ/RimL family protein N-acetyltransferase
LHPSEDRHGVIGYWVGTDRAGQGFATEALGALTMAALARGYLRFELRCDEANGAVDGAATSGRPVWSAG